MTMRGARHLLEYGLIRGAVVLDRVLGARRSEALVAWLGRLAYRPLGIRAALVEAHLRQAFPERDEGWIRGTAAESYAHLGREGMALLRLSRLGARDVLGVTDMPAALERVRAAVESGMGAVVVTGHLGNWEVAGAAIAARGIPVSVVVQRQSNPRFDGLIRATRERLGMRVVNRADGTRGSLRALRESRVIGLVADQDAGRAGIFVPFLGRAASTVRGPAVLAIRTGAPLFVGVVLRRPDGRYEGRLEEVAVPESGEFDERVRALTASYTRVLEAAVRADPGQYFWHHRRWKTRPAPGAEVVGNGGVDGAVQHERGDGSQRR
jgi:Kdo2-lipid IVA lauroyltransferase/acyltransferase